MYDSSFFLVFLLFLFSNFLQTSSNFLFVFFFFQADAQERAEAKIQEEQLAAAVAAQRTTEDGTTTDNTADSAISSDEAQIIEETSVERSVRLRQESEETCLWYVLYK